MRDYYSLLISLVSLPFGIGMLCAFLAAVRVMIFQAPTKSSRLWYGYSAGNYACVISSGLVMLIFLSLMGGPSVGEIVGSVLVTLVHVAIVSPILGLILYLPCSYLGCNLAARKRAEAELARTQQQMIEEREKELESSERDRN